MIKKILGGSQTGTLSSFNPFRTGFALAPIFSGILMHVLRDLVSRELWIENGIIIYHFKAIE